MAEAIVGFRRQALLWSVTLTAAAVLLIAAGWTGGRVLRLPAGENGLQAAAAEAPVSLQTDMPGYGFPALSGSVRCFNVKITGGTRHTVNWSVPGGGAVFLPFTGGTAESVSAGLPMQCIKITAPPGHITVETAGARATLSSNQVVTVRAQSVDDPRQSVDTPFYIAANTTRVRVLPAYQQVFLNQDADVTADVQGNADQSGRWTVVSSPGGSAPTLTDGDRRTAILHAGTPGRYTLKFTSTSEAQTNTAIIYMTAEKAPLYQATTGKTRPMPCAVDPALAGPVYEIGPGQRYADFVSTPSADTIQPGTMYRVHNADAAGAAPTVIHNYIQVVNSGTPSRPIVICGMPNASGELPVLDGDHATGQAGVAGGGACYQATPLCFAAGGYAKGHPTGNYQADPVGPNYVTVAGLHIRNTRGTLYPPGKQSGEQTQYEGLAGCVVVQSGTQIDLAGLDLENCANGIFTTENENNGFAATTLGVSLRYNHIHRFGREGSGTEHAIYFQTFFGLADGNLIDEPIASGKVGNCIKWRGIDGIFRYNYCAAGVGRDFDGVEVQDDSSYVDMTRWIDHGNYAAGDGTADIIAGLQETLYNGDWFYGNLIQHASGEALHYRGDHDGLMAERLGQFYVYNNTIDQVLTIFGVGDAQNGGSHYLDPLLHAFNNIFWSGGTVINYAFGLTDHLTNLYGPGVPLIPGPPITISSWYITSAGQLIVNGSNTLVNDYASGVTFSGLSGSSGACLNSTLFAVQYAGDGNFQGPTKCAPAGSAGAPIREVHAKAIPHILGGFPNGGTAHGWSNQCYYACPWELTVPLDTHQSGLISANFLVAARQPYDPGTFQAFRAAFNAGSELPPAAAQLPVQYQYNPASAAVEPRTQPRTIGGRDMTAGAGTAGVRGGTGAGRP